MRAWVAVAVLLPFLAGVPSTVGEETEAAIHLSDPEDDQGVPPLLGEQPTVKVPGYGAVDLVSLDVRLEGSDVRFTVGFRDLEVGGATGHPDSWGGAIRFALPETGCWYRVGFGVAATFVETPSGRGVLLESPNVDGALFADPPCSVWLPLAIRLDPQADVARFSVPLAALGAPWSDALWTPSRVNLSAVPTFLSNVWMFTTAAQNNPSGWVYANVGDALPAWGENSTERLTFPRAWPNVGLALRTTVGSLPYYVEPGRNESLTFALANRLDEPVIAHLNYTVVGAEADVARAHASGPPTVRVPAGEVRNYTAFVSREAGAGPVALEIEATSVLGGLVGLDRVDLAFGEALGPERNTLRFFARPFAGDTTYVGTPECLEPCLVETILSSLAAPAGYVDHGVRTYNSGSWPAPYARGPWAPTPMSLPTGAPVEVDLALSFKHPVRDVRITTSLVYVHPGGTERLLERVAERDTAYEKETFLFRQAPSKDRLLPPQGQFQLRFEVLQDSVSGFDAAEILLHLEDSEVRLPFVPIPKELVEPAQRSPFQVQPRSDTQEYVNPGESRLFRVEVLNMDSREQRLVVSAETSAAGWSVEVQPSSTFVLPSGASVNLGVLATAPADASEGATAAVFVNATSDDGARAGLRLVAITVRDMPFEDDRGSYTPGGDEVAYAERTPGGRSGTVTWGVLLATLAALTAARRRCARCNP